MNGGMWNLMCGGRTIKTKPSRYLVGIDLGTTHTVVAYTDTRAKTESSIQLFPVEQLVAPGEVAAKPLLPSLRYHPAEGELAQDDIRLPWVATDPGAIPHVVIGELARQLGTQVPGRLVASAKSWLSHAGVDRTASILPWGAEDVGKISPVDASASYLSHVRDTWNRRFPKHPLEKQDLVLTVPASFDAAARSLTIAAAQRAGLHQAHLLEEPQAACYAWIHHHTGNLSAALEDTKLLLVCDVGGGTTDLTLIQVTPGKDTPRFIRIGVGDHLMLGGDNMDLALAHLVEQRLGGERLSAARLSQLIQQCRLAKESLLAADGPNQTTVTLLGGGARLIGAARSTELTREEVNRLVVDGFLPLVSADEQPHRRRGGIIEFGLPYAADPAITRHIAAFLHQHTHAARQALDEQTLAEGQLAMPDAVLLNGGVFQSNTLSQRLLSTLAQWRGSPLRELHNADPNLAVAKGAVAYGLARRGQGIRIGGGSARSYFLLVDNQTEQQQGVCVLPRGSEEDREIRLSQRTFSLRLGEPVLFHLVSASGEELSQPGQVVDIDYTRFTTLPPIATVLGEQTENTVEVPVQVAAVLTEVGTLEMSCIAADDANQRWRLAFQLRGRGPENLANSVHPRFSEAAELLQRFYGDRSKEVSPKTIKTLRNDLEQVLGKRDNWNTALLRELFSLLWDGARRRRRSPDHERLWFSLSGYCLRPGFGYPLDDWRVQQLWSLYEQGVQYSQETRVWSEWWTLWRRIAGGLPESAQIRLLDGIANDLKPSLGKTRRTAKGTKSAKAANYDDKVQLVGSLERLPVKRKVEVGGWLLKRLQGKGESPQTWWAVGRLGSRVPLYGSAHSVLPRPVAQDWLKQILAQNWKTLPPAALAATLLARMSGDRERDIDENLCRQVAERLRMAKAPASWIRMVETVVVLEAADEKQLFGESLPPGLRLVN